MIILQHRKKFAKYENRKIVRGLQEIVALRKLLLFAREYSVNSDDFLGEDWLKKNISFFILCIRAIDKHLLTPKYCALRTHLIAVKSIQSNPSRVDSNNNNNRQKKKKNNQAFLLQQTQRLLITI